MKKTVRLTGLSRPKSMTCEPLNGGDFFWPKVEMSQDRFNALWDYWKDNTPSGGMLAEIECDKLSEDGTPINGKVISVEHF